MQDNNMTWYQTTKYKVTEQSRNRITIFHLFLGDMSIIHVVPTYNPKYWSFSPQEKRNFPKLKEVAEEKSNDLTRSLLSYIFAGKKIKGKI